MSAFAKGGPSLGPARARPKRPPRLCDFSQISRAEPATRDYSRLSCGIGDTRRLGPRARIAEASSRGRCAARSRAFFRKTVEFYNLIHLTFPLWICRLPANGSARDKSPKSSGRLRVVPSEGTMHYLLTAAYVVAFLSVIQESNAQDAVRFAPLQADQLTPEQKKWADTITAPPRNGKFSNPPYRAYIRSPELATLSQISSMQSLSVRAPRRRLRVWPFSRPAGSSTISRFLSTKASRSACCSRANSSREAQVMRASSFDRGFVLSPMVAKTPSSESHLELSVLLRSRRLADRWRFSSPD